MSEKTRGRCLCGAVRFEYDGAPLWSAHCHCESCRRATSSPVTTYIGVPRDRARFTGAEPAVYRSSPGVERLFCPTCGSPVAYRAERWPDEIHFFAASLDDPTQVTPQAHVFHAERLSWFETADDLPRYPGTGPDA